MTSTTPMATRRAALVSPAPTMRCARSRNSFEYFLGAGRLHLSVESGPPPEPGRFTQAQPNSSAHAANEIDITLDAGPDVCGTMVVAGFISRT